MGDWFSLLLLLLLKNLDVREPVTSETVLRRKHRGMLREMGTAEGYIHRRPALHEHPIASNR